MQPPSLAEPHNLEEGLPLPNPRKCAIWLLLLWQGRSRGRKRRKPKKCFGGEYSEPKSKWYLVASLMAL
jgi:hypothetical protein